MAITVTGTSTNITGLTPGTQYRFRVAARNAIGTGPYSDWSAAGTPTGGGGGGGGGDPTAATVTVSVANTGYIVTGQPGQTTAATVLFGFANTGYSLSDSGAQIGRVSWRWQGRYRRYANARSQNTGFVDTFQVCSPSDWEDIPDSLVSSDVGQSQKFYRSNILNSMSVGVRGVDMANRQWTFPSHYWQIRVRATVSYIPSGGGAPQTAIGYSRAIAFKEMWNNVDYDTQVNDCTPIP